MFEELQHALRKDLRDFLRDSVVSTALEDIFEALDLLRLKAANNYRLKSFLNGPFIDYVAGECAAYDMARAA
jgi:hypothetical protein